MELELSVDSPCGLKPSSALLNLSTKFNVSFGDNSPSSPHLRLDKSGGHMKRTYQLNETRVFQAVVALVRFEVI